MLKATISKTSCGAGGADRARKQTVRQTVNDRRTVRVNAGSRGRHQAEARRDRHTRIDRIAAARSRVDIPLRRALGSASARSVCARCSSPLPPFSWSRVPPPQIVRPARICCRPVPLVTPPNRWRPTSGPPPSASKRASGWRNSTNGWTRSTNSSRPPTPSASPAEPCFHLAPARCAAYRFVDALASSPRRAARCRLGGVCRSRPRADRSLRADG